MEIIEPGIIFPEVKLEYIIEDGIKKFRVVCDRVDPVLIHLLKSREIRMQVWLERELKKGSGGHIKRSWVHSIDSSSKAPSRLFTNSQYNYGGGLGWGWMTQGLLPPYSTTNGYAPSEFEVTTDDMLGQRMVKRIDILDIFSNIIKRRGQSTYAVSEDSIEYLAILGKSKSRGQPLRVRLVVNYDGKVYKSEPSNPIILGIHQDNYLDEFDENNLKRHVKVSYYK